MQFQSLIAPFDMNLINVADDWPARRLDVHRSQYSYIYTLCVCVCVSEYSSSELPARQASCLFDCLSGRPTRRLAERALSDWVSATYRTALLVSQSKQL